MIESNNIPERFIPANYRRCTKTVMDNISDPDITFDEKGICNYYYEYFQHIPKEVSDPAFGGAELKKIVAEIKNTGKGKKYDCIIGVSGGVDSTYVALKVKELGLRPLVVHFDNGWNSEIAVKNIENITHTLGFDLYTHVFEWEEFKDIQLAFFKAHVIDIEAITDIAIRGVLNMLALKYDIKYIISGNNYRTESILPHSWTYKDYLNIVDIHKKFGTRSIRLFPFYDNLLKKLKMKFSGCKIICLLDYIDYNKTIAKQQIAKELHWQDYGGKHYESIFTRFYQGYILPQKFGIDKRKAHLTNLICSGEITRKHALLELEKPMYAIEQLRTDYPFVIKKLGFTESGFDEYLNTPGQSHHNFDTQDKYWERNKLKKSLKNLLVKVTS